MEKINIAQLLKDCPKGMELDCSMWDKITLEDVYDGNPYPIKINTPEGICSLSQFGCFSLNKEAKCIIFPKGKTTWEGFQRPFKDGDVLITDSNALCIYKSIHKTYRHMSLIDYYCGYRTSDNQLVINKFNDSHFGCISKAKLATEEEKEKLFKAIKNNGYKWNAKTKTLEKLIVPKFKVGDKIKYKNGKDINGVEQGVILFITDDAYDVAVTNDMGIIVTIADQDNWELVPNKFDISTLVPFKSAVLIRNDKTQKWIPAFWGYKANNGNYVTTFGTCIYCIPYEGNEHLLGTASDCDDFYKTW